jgi:hypothetical protein
MDNDLKTNVPVRAAAMTLRDYFAGQALVGILAHSGGFSSSPEDIAEYAYKQADAMISVRRG